MAKLNFSARLTLYIFFTTSAVFLLAFGYNFLQTQRSIRSLSLEKAAVQTQLTIEKIEQVLQRVEQTPQYLAQRLASTQLSATEIETMLRTFVATSPDVYGATVAFAPGALKDASEYFAPYYYKSTGQLHRVDLADDGYKYWYQDWYIEPRQAGKPIWSEPYHDEGGGETLMCTYSVPVYRTGADGKSHFLAIITADIAIDWLQQLVSGIKVYDTGHAFILSRMGTFVIHRNPEFMMRSDLSIYELAVTHNAPWLTELGHNMTSGKRGTSAMTSIETGQDVEVTYAPLPSNGWSLALFIPEDELYAELRTQTILVALLSLGGITGIAILVCIVAFRATAPLRDLCQSTTEIAKGGLEVQLPKVARMDEIGTLTHSFEEMRAALKEYIADLTSATAAKERIESELKIARTIQASFLPKHFPPFPERTEFDIYASLISAREVGGDLYDFFIIDKDLLFFSVGDVSDKGVPAALFMAVTKTLMKGIAEHERSPAEILNRVNNELASDNDSCMFVTLFCGILNVRTGEMVYANAGHDAPLLLRQGQPVVSLESTAGLVLGAMEDVQYQDMQTQLAKGDTLILFTDGITEAMSPEKALFTMERLIEAAQDCIGDPVQKNVEDIRSAVQQHAAEAEQSDDMTLMSLQWHGPSGN